MNLSSVQQRFGVFVRQLRWVHRPFAILFPVELIYALIAAIFASDLPGHGLVHALLFLAALPVLWSCFRWGTGKVLWRVRNRLLVTYFLVGVVPIVLLAVIVSLASFALMGQIAGYLLTDSVDRRLQVLANAASDIAANSATPNPDAIGNAVTNVRLREPRLEAWVVLSGNAGLPGVFPQTPNNAFPGPRNPGPAAQPEPVVTGGAIPPTAWMQPGLRDIVVAPPPTGRVGDAELQLPDLHLAAFVRFQRGPRSVDVLVTEPLDAITLGELAGGLGTVALGRGGPNATGFDNADNAPLPDAAGLWDVQIDWLALLDARTLADGGTRQLFAQITSRPSLIVTRIFSTSQFGGVVGTLLLVVGGIFLAVEIVSLILIGRLTRSITCTVEDTYEATRQVEAGNLSHRIPIRSRDQLSTMARSFNSMTGQIQHLIAEVKEKERIEHELTIAREVQALLFPTSAPIFHDLEMAGVCKPARVVSGDYYDFVPLDERHIAIIIGDIAGKGMSAALLMASLQSSVRALLTALGPALDAGETPSPARVVTQLNRQIFASTGSDKFSTIFCGVYDGHSGLLRYTNAGHPPPRIVGPNAIRPLEITGGLVGAFSDSTFAEETCEFRAGDLLVATTDGVTECENAAGEPFGDKRLAELLQLNENEPIDALLDRILDATLAWAPGLPDQDDTTIVLARRIQDPPFFLDPLAVG